MEKSLRFSNKIILYHFTVCYLGNTIDHKFSKSQIRQNDERGSENDFTVVFLQFVLFTKGVEFDHENNGNEKLDEYCQIMNNRGRGWNHGEKDQSINNVNDEKGKQIYVFFYFIQFQYKKVFHVYIYETFLER
jgi:hypothetical protein